MRIATKRRFHVVRDSKQSIQGIDAAALVTKELEFTLPQQAQKAIDALRPVLTNWMGAESFFQKNTKHVAEATAQAFKLYRKAHRGAGRFQFAREFDITIGETAKRRELSKNATYNRLAYLLDKVLTRRKNRRNPRVDRRPQLIRTEWLAFSRSFDPKRTEPKDLRNLLKLILGHVFDEDTVELILRSEARAKAA